MTVTLAIAACGGGDDDGTEADRPGNPDVYARIEAETDCQLLQTEFDTASANFDRAVEAENAEQREWTLAYMEAADDRMRAVDCYD